MNLGSLSTVFNDSGRNLSTMERRLAQPVSHQKVFSASPPAQKPPR